MAQVLALPKAQICEKTSTKLLSKGKNPVSDPIFQLMCEVFLLTFLDKTIFRQGWVLGWGHSEGESLFWRKE